MFTNIMLIIIALLLFRIIQLLGSNAVNQQIMYDSDHEMFKATNTNLRAIKNAVDRIVDRI